MVIFCKRESLQRHNVSPNRLIAALSQGGLGCHGQLALICVVIKDRIFIVGYACLLGVTVAVPKDI